MSDPRSKAERSKAKDIRQGLPQRAVVRGKKKRIDKPYQVWRRYVWISESDPTMDWLLHKDWRYTYHKFATFDLAQQYIEKEIRSELGFIRNRYRVEYEVREVE
jgi:hypothetical protein